MRRLQALADAYQVALRSQGKQAAKKAVSEALHEAKESPEKEKAEEE